MEYKIEDFDDFFDNSDKYSDEEKIEMFEKWLIFMKTNQETFNFTDEVIAEGAKLVETSKKSHIKVKETEKKLNIANEEAEIAVRRLDEAIDDIEAQGGKVPPMFTKLPSKKHGSH